MKILLVDRLNYPYGGTQKYVFSLAKLLNEHGHTVWIFNGKDLITDLSNETNYCNQQKFTFIQKLESIYSISILIKSIKLFRKIQPEIIHLNNINYKITPSIIHAAKLLQIPVVAHLHDYKIVCNKYTLINKKQQVCYDCKNRYFGSIIKNKCTRKNNNNIFESLYLYLESFIHHKILNIFSLVDCYISPSLYMSNTFKRMGFNNKINVIRNFTYFSTKEKHIKKTKTNKIIYFGRFTSEKGLLSLVNTVKNMTAIKLSLVGSGPLYPQLLKIAHETNNIKIYDFMEEKKLKKFINLHDATITPSIWPENASISIIESLAMGKPVIASDNGGNPEMINSNNGWVFSYKQTKSFKKTLIDFINTSHPKLQKLSQNAYSTFKNKYSPEIHYQSIISLYKTLINSK